MYATAQGDQRPASVTHARLLYTGNTGRLTDGQKSRSATRQLVYRTFAHNGKVCHVLWTAVPIAYLSTRRVKEEVTVLIHQQ